MLNATERARELRDAGATFQFIAETLIAEGYPTKRGGRWQKASVRQMLLPPKPPRAAPDLSPPLTELGDGEVPDVLARARALRAKGATLTEVAGALQAEQYPTLRGGTWASGQVWTLLNSPRPRSALLVPCTVCGDPTASKCGICSRRPTCRPAYIAAANRAAAERLRESAEPSKPCASCGRPTTSELGVCTRRSCWNEYARRGRAAQVGGSYVYAIWFPSPCILKVGFSTLMTGMRFVASVRERARLRNWDPEGSSCIWKQPGDTRTEAWMQATLAFRWLAPFKQKDGRLCEWFTVPGLAVEEITEVLDDVYGRVPADLVADGLEPEEPLLLF